MERDLENKKALRFREWTVLRFWGEDIRKHTDECVRAVEEAIFEQKISIGEDFNVTP
jgi:DNA mismatch endonuclease (patch repair protein)